MFKIFEQKLDKEIFLKNFQANKLNCIITVSDIGNLKENQEIFILAPVTIKLSCGKEEKIKAIIARLGIRKIKGNLIYLEPVYQTNKEFSKIVSEIKEHLSNLDTIYIEKI